jgi:hypothetical protein
MMQGKGSSAAARVAKAVAMLLRARRLNTPQARAEADLVLGSLSRIELREALFRAGEQTEPSEPPPTAA